MSKSKIYDLTKEELQNLFDRSNSYSDILRKIGISGGSSRTTLKKAIDFYSIDTKQLEINRRNFKKKTNLPHAKYNLEEKLVKNSTPNSHKLKNKLIEAGYKKAECEICGLSTWLDKPIKLHLHHKDGDHTNNTLENLQILCPNCHSMTDNYGVYNSAKYINNKKTNKKVKKIKKNKKELCPVCNTNMKYRRYNMCVECSYKSRSKIIERDTLKNLIRTIPFLQIAKEYNVSDNTIRKWCKKYDLPFKSKEIKSYSDEEWVLI